MKIIFLLDDDSAVVTPPEQLQLRQIQPDLAALVIPAGKNEDGEETFRPFVTYPVALVAPPPKADPPVVEATPIDSKPAKKAAKKK